ncbi:MAG: hypothetical protein KDH15_12100 [Rhodocyclaceae bacterium]|nr:hypothetical protein [Rhodocyclaceae bacterium]
MCTCQAPERYDASCCLDAAAAVVEELYGVIVDDIAFGHEHAIDRAAALAHGARELLRPVQRHFEE